MRYLQTLMTTVTATSVNNMSTKEFARMNPWSKIKVLSVIWLCVAVLSFLDNFATSSACFG